MTTEEFIDAVYEALNIQCQVTACYRTDIYGWLENSRWAKESNGFRTAFPYCPRHYGQKKTQPGVKEVFHS